LSKPGFFFYPGDWMKDTACLTLDCQGAYLRWLCGPLLQHGGQVAWPVSAFANYVGTTEEIARSMLHQLELTNVAIVEWQNDGKSMAKLSNRRLVREAENRQRVSVVRSDVGKKGAAKRWQKWQPSSSSSESSSLISQKTKTAAPNGFAEFWALYPNKKSKGQAEKTWLKMKVTPELLGTILAGIKRAKQSRNWLKNSGEFIPYPSTWLNAKGWEDQEISYAPPKSVPAPKSVDPEPSPEEKARNEEFLRETITGLSRKFSR